MDRLKARWGITSARQFWIIMLVFALTGTSAVLVKRLAFEAIGVTPDWPWWQRTLLWCAIVLPAYQVLLLAYGALFGQLRFFWWFLKKMFGVRTPPPTQADSAER